MWTCGLPHKQKPLSLPRFRGGGAVPPNPHPWRLDPAGELRPQTLWWATAPKTSIPGAITAHHVM